MAYERRSFAGAAVATTLDGGIDGSTLSITIASTTGWPSGSGGDFFAVIDRGLATEEKVRIDTRTGTSLTVASGGRGADGTAAAAHSSGATIELCLTAVDLDEANAHLADTALDHHTQYLNTTRHDVEARHTFGAALGTPVAPSSIGTANAAGTGDNPAREDHVHEIGTGAIDTSAQFAAGVVDSAAIATDAVGTAEIAAGAVTASELAADAVTTAKILDANVTTAKIADANVTEGKLAADSVTAAKIAAGAVGTTELADDAVTSAKLAVPTIAGSTVDTTSLGGDLSIPFGVTFAAAPVVVACNGDAAQGFAEVAVLSTTTTGCTVRCFNAAGAVVVSTELRINWTATGALA